MRTKSIFFIVTGLIAACISALGLVGAAVPLEDPSPAQLDHQSMSINLWWFAITGSLLVFAFGIRGLWKSGK